MRASLKKINRSVFHRRISTLPRSERRSVLQLPVALLQVLVLAGAMSGGCMRSYPSSGLTHSNGPNRFGRISKLLEDEMADQITIEPLAPSDFGLVAQWLSSSENNRWLTSEFRGRTVEPVTIGIFVRNAKNRFYLVRVCGEPAGVVGLGEFDQTDRLAMVWYALGDKKFAGRGVTTEGVRQMSYLAFKDLGLKSLYAWIMEDNARSRRVLEKSGFREVGRIRSATHSGTEQRDRVYFDLVPADLGL